MATIEFSQWPEIRADELRRRRQREEAVLKRLGFEDGVLQAEDFAGAMLAVAEKLLDRIEAWEARQP